MFLKSLELNGFKSFAQRTTFEFPHGITAVVGPNGSGKSNIIDAVRWLLGERDAKSLRGAKTEDLIWNGSPARPRMGMAQAALHFDNESGFFPVDSSEVVISRRLDRDGTSEYFLNKAEVRLKDIVDFLSRARLGTKGLIVIGQGSSDLFVRVSPEERHIMIEEILGLREYQLKKNEAERKLKSTFFNLEKVRAMIEEVLPRLRLLKRQTGKWEKRQGIADELSGLENIYFGKALRELNEIENSLKPSFAALDDSHDKKKRELVEREEKLAEVEKNKDAGAVWKEIQKRKGDLVLKRNEMERSFTRMEVRLEVAKENARKSGSAARPHEFTGVLNELRDFLREAKVTGDLAKLHSLIGKALARIDQFLGEGEAPPKKELDPALLEEKEKLTNDLKEIDGQIKLIEKEENEIAAGFESFNALFKAAFEAVELKKEEMRKLESEKARINFEKEKVEMRRDELKHQIEQAGRKIEEFKGIEISGGGYSAGELERKIFRLRGELASIGEIDEGLVNEAKEVETHYEFLTAQSKDLEIAAKDLKDLIRELSRKVHDEFTGALKNINDEFNHFFRLMFGGGGAKLKVRSSKSKVDEEDGEKENNKNNGEKKDDDNGNDGDKEEKIGVDIELNLPKKRITNLDMLSGGEKSLVSIAALFALISVSPPPFLVLDEIDAPLDESNSRRFSNLIKDFSKKTQFIVVTHNRSTMEAADVLYGITMGDEGCSKVISLKLEGVAGK